MASSNTLLCDNTKNIPYVDLSKYPVKKEIVCDLEKKLKRNTNLDINDPVSGEKTCALIGSKKTRYYTHTYNPNAILENIKVEQKNNNISVEKSNEYIENFNKIFDTKQRKDCCKCISVSLYSLDIKYINNVISSIKRTAINVKNNLPDWIVRFYVDLSVYEKIKDNEDETIDNFVKSQMKWLESAENVEIWTYICKDRLSETQSIEKTRTYRFMPLVDKEVACCIIREADGIVSNYDCHNIDVFSKSNRMFYIAHIFDIDYLNSLYGDSNVNPFRTYSEWLEFYYFLIDTDFKSKNVIFCDILAGIFGSNLCVKSDVYYKISELVKVNCDGYKYRNSKNIKEIDEKRRSNANKLESIENERKEKIKPSQNKIEELLDTIDSISMQNLWGNKSEEEQDKMDKEIESIRQNIENTKKEILEIEKKFDIEKQEELTKIREDIESMRKVRENRNKSIHEEIEKRKGKYSVYSSEKLIETKIDRIINRTKLDSESNLKDIDTGGIDYLLDTGYDEILLYELFKNFIKSDIVTKDEKPHHDMPMRNFISSILYSYNAGGKQMVEKSWEDVLTKLGTEGYINQSVIDTCKAMYKIEFEYPSLMLDMVFAKKNIMEKLKNEILWVFYADKNLMDLLNRKYAEHSDNICKDAEARVKYNIFIGDDKKYSELCKEDRQIHMNIDKLYELFSDYDTEKDKKIEHSMSPMLKEYIKNTYADNKHMYKLLFEK
jgi:hypothetical protein